MSMLGNDCAGVILDKDYFGESLTRQSEKAYADINTIMRKYLKTGVLPPATREGFFADVSMVEDYREAIARVERADELFLHLDPKVRENFSNDPAEFLDFVTARNEDGSLANLSKMEELGLISPEVKMPPAVPVSPPIDPNSPVVPPPPAAVPPASPEA